MQQVKGDDRTALQHAQDWKRSATVLFLTCFVVAGAAFWAAQAGFGSLWAKIGSLAILVGAMSGVAAFVCGVRIIQLSRDKN
jgi:hypothetical protein